MNREQIEKYIDENESNYGDLNHFQRLLEGMNILKDYPNDSIGSGHDQIYLADVPEKMDEVDVEKLVNLGFFIDEDSWSMFV